MQQHFIFMRSDRSARGPAAMESPRGTDGAIVPWLREADALRERLWRQVSPLSLYEWGQLQKGKKEGFLVKTPERNGERSGIRTHDLWLRRPTLYPAELRAR